jgi:hypothetical protein
MVGYANDKLKVILDAQFRNGKLVTIYVPQRYANDIDIPSKVTEERSDPWIDNMGIFQNDPTRHENRTSNTGIVV